MSNFFNLIYNELTKVYLRKSTWIMYIVIALLIIGFGMLNKVFDDSADARTYGDDWREVLLAENEAVMQEQKAVEDRLAAYDEKHGDENQDKDGWDPERFAIEMDKPDMNVLERNNLYLEADTKPSGYGAWQFVVSNTGMLNVVILLTIIIAAGMIAYEFRWGTIKMLLIRPISRTRIFFSKYISVLLYAIITIVFVIMFSWLTGAVLYGIEGVNANMITESMSGDYSGEIVSTYKQIMMNYGFAYLEIVMMSTLAFMISAVFRNSTLAVGTSIFLFFAGATVTMILIGMEVKIAKYLLFTHLDLSQYVTGNLFIEGTTLGFSITILIVYYVLFIGSAWLTFVKRDVA